eukprot:7079941-Prymnesium_polylepis.1
MADDVARGGIGSLRAPGSCDLSSTRSASLWEANSWSHDHTVHVRVSFLVYRTVRMLVDHVRRCEQPAALCTGSHLGGGLVRSPGSPPENIA